MGKGYAPPSPPPIRPKRPFPASISLDLAGECPPHPSRPFLYLAACFPSPCFSTRAIRTTLIVFPRASPLGFL